MTEKKSDWGDISVKIIIAVVVPITVAIIGIYGNMIVSQAGQNQRALERLVRQAEAETAFRRDMFAELFNDYVDQISVTETPAQLDALATRLELLSSNFSDFLALRPLYLQLDRQIDHVLPLGGTDESVQILRDSYLKRLASAAKTISAAQAAQISQRGVTRLIQIKTDSFNRPNAAYLWPDDSFPDIAPEILQTEIRRFVLDEVVRSIGFRISHLDIKQKTMRVELSAADIDPDKPGSHYRAIHQAAFHLDYFAFPLENYIVLSHNHRLAMSLAYFDEKIVEIRLQIFRHTAGNLQMAQFLDITTVLRHKEIARYRVPLCCFANLAPVVADFQS